MTCSNCTYFNCKEKFCVGEYIRYNVLMHSKDTCINPKKEEKNETKQDN